MSRHLRALAAALLGLALCAGVDSSAQGPTSAKVWSTGNTTIRVAFPPEDDATGLIVQAIRQARHEIRVQAYLFTSRRIAQALIEAWKRGVEVQAIGDAEQFEKGGAPMLTKLAAAGIPVFLDAAHGAAHDKVLLVDAHAGHPVVITGSFNFTVAAQNRNAENLLAIAGNRELATAYLANWERHREHSQRLH